MEDYTYWTDFLFQGMSLLQRHYRSGAIAERVKIFCLPDFSLVFVGFSLSLIALAEMAVVAQLDENGFL